MIHRKTFTALTLAAIAASTSLAGAAGNGPNLGKMPTGPILKPIIIIDVTPKPDIPFIPIDIPKKPDIPFIPLPIDFGDKGEAEPMLLLDCTVRDPLGATDNFWIVNIGNVALPGGLKVKYRVPASGDHGAFLLPRDVPVGGKLLIADLLHDAPSGAPCTAQIIA